MSDNPLKFAAENRPGKVTEAMVYEMVDRLNGTNFVVASGRKYKVIYREAGGQMKASWAREDRAAEPGLTSLSGRGA